MNIGTVFGLPIRFVDEEMIAEAKGVWPWKYIEVGRLFESFTCGEQVAILAHEAWHCQRFHLEARILALPLLLLGGARKLCHEQEFAADAHAASMGLAQDMRSVVLHTAADGNDWHPPRDERVQRLLPWIERKHDVPTV